MAAPNSVPRFMDVGLIGAQSIATANTNRDGTGTVPIVVTAGAQGSLITWIRMVAIVATTAGVIRLYLHDGSNFFLLEEMLVTAITPSATVKVWEDEYVPTNPIILPAGYSIRAAPHNAEAFKVFAFGGSY